MPRLRLALLLPLLVVLAQQGALLHELTHVYYSGRTVGAQLRGDDQLPDNASCPACQAFAQVTHPASGSAPAFTMPQVPHLRSPDPAYRIVHADAPTPRSRGPPQARA
ncbi:MAG TPA: hypothetical protein VMD03_05490 [Steroidobacteraceae bacterium]|nr:hypothetical protein [Steroidobacteraceae bacterium]